MEYRISDLKQYTFGMSKSLLDKTYFMNYLDESVKYILDYGCADGAMIGYLAGMWPSIKFVGYDTNQEMIDKANEENAVGENTVFTTDWEEVVSICNPDETAVVLSSVLHEVMTYCNSIEIHDFLSRLTEFNPKYFCVREMSINENYSKEITATAKKQLKAVLESDPDLAQRASEFEEYWGSLFETRHLLHFLYKYRYVDNWDRELREYYLAFSNRDIKKMFSEGREIIYSDHSPLPYLVGKIREDWGSEIADIMMRLGTHTKLVSKRTDADLPPEDDPIPDDPEHNDDPEQTHDPEPDVEGDETGDNVNPDENTDP